MRVFSPGYEDLLKKTESDSKARFALTRWAELLDPNTPLCFSAYLEMLPLESIDDSLDLFLLYDTKSYFAMGHLIASLRRTLLILQQDRIIAKPIFAKVTPLVQKLDIFLKELDRTPKGKPSEEDLQYNIVNLSKSASRLQKNPLTNPNDIRSIIDSINKLKSTHAEGASSTKPKTYHEDKTFRQQFIDENRVQIFQMLQDAKNEIEAKYISELLKFLDKNLNSIYTHSNELKNIDYALTRTVMFNIYQGKDPIHLVYKIQNDLKREQNITRKLVYSSIEDISYSEKRPFKVAIVLDGVGFINNSDLPESIQAKISNVKDPVSWEADSKKDHKLNDFYIEHTQTTKVRRKSSTLPALVKIIHVSAWDVEDARRQALFVAETIADLANAINRNKRVGVKRKVCVLDIDKDYCHMLKGDSRTFGELRTMSVSSHRNLANSLRYASRVKTERNPMVSVLFAWIALESFFSGKEDAQYKVISTIPYFALRSAIQCLITYVDSILHNEISRIENNDEENDVSEDAYSQPEKKPYLAIQQTLHDKNLFE